ncbi:hypothetical protein ACFVWG_28775 [Kribbella sp. NPDC058245]|uniref:hypothetical protein n=1 Tax=Kribbella sp. NPDC058245 TaxID=3346399 RepID=UPI0036EC4905
MSEEPPVRIDEMAAALRDRELPTVGLWNRLEGRPRTTDFSRALRAEVRDPLWMLSRQWQLGEFRGSDGGSPVTATYHVEVTTPSRFRPGDGAVQELKPDYPLESRAERRKVPFTIGTDRISYDLRLAIGRRWLKMIGANDLIPTVLGLGAKYVKRWPIAAPNPDLDLDSARVAHPEVWSAQQTVAGRRMDGYELYLHCKSGGFADNGIPGLLTNILAAAELRRLGPLLVAWFDELIDQPVDNGAWDSSRLEHRFSVAAQTATGERVLTAEEYPGGDLDWHAFSIDSQATLGGAAPPSAPVTTTVFPAPVRFSGMPLPRWWAFEDGRTNFASVRPDSTDLARLVFLEFALVYSNDWYVVPCDLPAGAIATVQGLAVTDVFEERLWVTPAGAGDDEDKRRWAMFGLDTIGSEHVSADTSLYLPATVPKVSEGPTLEEALLVRDENANMVWAIEQTVPLATGRGRRGSEVAAERTAYRRKFWPEVEATGPLAPVAYETMSSVPDHWIPFVPVQVAGSNRTIQLRRGAMLGIDGQPVRPQTSLLREGLVANKGKYLVHEEEVPRTGTTVTTAYNRTRWRDGSVSLWLSAKRSSGRGEASSGLAFDRLVDTPPKQ